MALSNLSLTYQQLGQWQAANRAIKDSVELLKSSTKHDRLLAQTLDIQGKLQRETGKAADAIDSWQQSATIYRQINESEALTQNNLNQAQALQDLGLYPRACKKILTVLSIDNIATCQQLNLVTETEFTDKLKKITTNNPNINKALALKSLGDLLLIIGQPDRSQQVLASSLTVAEKLNSPAELANIYLSIGKTAQSLTTKEAEPLIRLRREYQKQALTAYDRVIILSDNATIQQQAKLNKLGLLLQSQKWAEAENLWQ
jgi:tetratricopeptide (TPR) repeat protein